MANIFTRKALNDIMSNEELTPEQRTEQVFGLYGRALDDGYIAKAAAQQAQQTADNGGQQYNAGGAQGGDNVYDADFNDVD